MTVPAQIPTNVSTANGLTTTFPYNFRILDKSHLLVKVDGVPQEVDVDYTVTGVGDNNGGNVVFGVAPVAGKIIRRSRSMPFERLVNYLTGGDFLASVVNADQDAPVMMIQQLAQTVNELIVALGQDIDNSIIDQTYILNVGQLRYLIPIKSIPGTTHVVDKGFESALALCTNSAPVAITLRANDGDKALDFSTGAFVSFRQTTAGGQVTVAGDVGVTLTAPAGYLPKSRALGSIITATCEFGEGEGRWVLSGDLAIDPDYVPGGGAYIAVPQNSQSAAYTLQLSDSGKHLLHPSADTTARVWTIPANASVPFPIGAAVTFVNQNGAGAITIAITSDTMRLAGAGTTGSRTLAANGVATALKISATEWIISGTGLT